MPTRPLCPFEALALQHLAEDMSIIPYAADWLQHLQCPADDRPAQAPPDAASPERLAAASARHFGTAPEILLPLHSWFLETAAWFLDARHFAIRHHSFGIFQAVIWTDQPPLDSPTVKAPREGEAWPLRLTSHASAAPCFIRPNPEIN
jgi:hypothetical protein